MKHLLTTKNEVSRRASHEDDLYPSAELPFVIDTPTTKSDASDLCITPDELVTLGAISREQYVNIRNSSLVAFGAASHFLRTKGLILVDTKTEHGLNSRGQIVSQDELYTFDSSRLWLEHDYKLQLDLYLHGKDEELARYLYQRHGLQEQDYVQGNRVVITPASYSKEFARGFSKGDNLYTPDEQQQISARYLESIGRLTGAAFRPDLRSREERVMEGLEKVVVLLA